MKTIITCVSKWEQDKNGFSLETIAQVGSRSKSMLSIEFRILLEGEFGEGFGVNRLAHGPEGRRSLLLKALHGRGQCWKGLNKKPTG